MVAAHEAGNAPVPCTHDRQSSGRPVPCPCTARGRPPGAPSLRGTAARSGMASWVPAAGAAAANTRVTPSLGPKSVVHNQCAIISPCPPAHLYCIERLACNDTSAATQRSGNQFLRDGAQVVARRRGGIRARGHDAVSHVTDPRRHGLRRDPPLRRGRGGARGPPPAARPISLACVVHGRGRAPRGDRWSERRGRASNGGVAVAVLTVCACVGRRCGGGEGVAASCVPRASARHTP